MGVSLLKLGVGLSVALGLGRAQPSGVKRASVERGGLVFQSDACPQAISKEEAAALEADESLPGGILSVGSLDAIGRSGNHYEVVTRVFSMSFCCQYKVVTMPEQDTVLPTENGDTLELRHNTYSFSSADAALRTEHLGYADISTDPDICPPIKHLSGQKTKEFTREGVHERLLQCMLRVEMIGCVAHFLHDVVGADDAFCSWKYEGEEERGSLMQATSAEEGQDKRNAGSSPRGKGQSLVVHMRSGDIFLPELSDIPWYGQPPLQFYLKVIGSRPWSNISVLTNARIQREFNPAFGVLQELDKQGLLGAPANFYPDRNLRMDLRDMLCAENVVLAKSSITHLLVRHSRAKRFFLPTSCARGGPFFVDRICLYRPDVEVYGIEWKTSLNEYSVYDEWINTDAQRLEMITSDEVKSIQRCCVK
ncbi:unnamed protein product [Ectocarpus sp. 6 AP-2014]